MPRPPRLHVPGGFYHVILRGNHREPLFGSAADRLALNEIVTSAIERLYVRVHAFCWMSNHLHAVMQVAERPLNEVMQRIAMRYSRYRHKILGTTGHLFERRYHARLVDADVYFLTLLRYVHFNPVKAGIVARPEEYPWSSHRAYLGIEHVPWLTVDFGLSLLASNTRRARAEYRLFMADMSDEEDLERQLAANPDDGRVLGTDEFVSGLRAPEIRSRSKLTLEQLAEMISARHEVSLRLVRSRSSQHALTPVRLEIAREAMSRQVAGLSDVARFLNRDPSTLCKLLSGRAQKFQKSKSGT